MDFGERLQQLRRQHGLSQEALGERLGVTRQAVSKWESGAAYPETEKIMALCQLYGVTADDLLLGAGLTPDKAPGKRALTLRILPVCCVLLVVALIIAGVVKDRAHKTALEEYQSRYSMIEQENAALKQELNADFSEERAETDALRSTKDDFEQIRLHFLEFARVWRLDYVPFFEPDRQPTESADYLMWAYAINLDGWSEEEQGTMSRDYVQDRIFAHFAVPDVSHTPLRKTWNYNGEVYSAIPGGMKELPIYVLESIALDNDVFTVEAANCGVWREGQFETATDEELEKLENGISDAYGSWLRPMMIERISFKISHNGPVFLSHCMVEEADLEKP